MNSINRVLLASHGSEGAIAAESAAVAACTERTTLTHLIVVPTLWKDMMGDDWLNNGISRDRFARHLESELGREIDEHRERVQQQSGQHQIDYHCEIVVGEPDECLINACKKEQYDLVVMGSPRPRGKPGLRSRMSTKRVTKQLTTPLMIVPYPDAPNE